MTASRGGDALYSFLGNGHGNLSAATRVGLPGGVTAVVTGEIDRVDGLADVAFGVLGKDGPEALVLQALDGRLSDDWGVETVSAGSELLRVISFVVDSG